MATKSIDTIQIGSYPVGQFAGGYIYSMNLDQGYAEEVNKLSVDIVFDNSYDIESNLPSKNFSNPFVIKVGSLYLPEMYFFSHVLNVNVGQKTLSITFIDNSIKLDRYYVGLKGRHGSNDAGNLLVVGTEIKNLDEPCNVGDIQYKFSELISKIQSLGISIGGTYVNYPDIYLNYSGSIRQVLSNIGSDFGFSFYWDILKNKLILVDLSNTISLNAIENLISSNFSNSTNQNILMPIVDLKKEETLEGTYAKSSSNFSVKNGGIKEVSHTEFAITRYQNIPANITNLKLCFLASVNPTLRTLHALSEANYSAAGVFGFQAFNSFEMKYISDIFSSFINEVSSRGFAHVYGSCTALDNEGEKAIVQLESNEFQNYGKFYKRMSLVTVAPDICTSSYSRKTTITQWPGADGISNQGWGSSTGADFTRSPNTTVDYWLPANLDPIFLPITDDLAEQLIQYAKANGIYSQIFNLRNKILVAFPKITVSMTDGINPNEENYQQAQWEVTNSGGGDCLDCRRKSNQNSNPEIILSEPGKGLNSKKAKIINVRTPGGGYLIGYLPSTDLYLGYIKLDVVEQFNDSASVSITQGQTSIPNTVMQYEHAAVDITNKQNQSLRPISISSNPLKNISFKIIGTDFSQISPYMNPESGLTSFSIFLDDAGIYSNFTFQNRPPIAPNSEEIMEKVAARKTSLIG